MEQQAKPQINIIGIGMGNPDTLTVEAARLIAQSDCLIGAKRLLEAFPDNPAVKHSAIYPQEIADFLAERQEFRQVAVVMSGDVGFYSGAKKLVQALAAYQPRLVCGISSVVYFCAQLQTSWDDVHLLSAHGRVCNVAAEVMNYPKVFLLTGGQQTVATICRELCNAGLTEVAVHIGQRLSYQDELICSGQPADFCEQAFDSLSVMLIENRHSLQDSVTTQGLPDEAFIRGETPMTKSEVRAISLAKMQLKPTDVVYDVGAGTGSVAVEAALQVKQGRVYAIEKNPQALGLLAQNKAKFGAVNLQIVPGAAPEVLTALPAPDVVFIGGSSGQLAAVLTVLLEKNPSLRVVVNAIALETLAEAVHCLEQFAFEEVEIVQAAISKTRKVAQYHMLTGQNPIFIISGRGHGHEPQ